jgi:AcrR family transcriptional regulator
MLKDIIEERAISVPKLAEKMGVSPATIYRHLKGDGMTIGTAKIYADFLKVSVDEIVGEK